MADNNAYLCTKGKVFVTRGESKDRNSFYAIKELAPSVNLTFSEIRRSEPDLPIIIDNVSFNKVDRVFPMNCFNNVKVLFRFGTDFGQVSISGRIFFGNSSREPSAALNNLTTWFNENRVTKTGYPLALSIIGRQTVEFFMTGLTFPQNNPELNMQSFVISGISFERVGGKIDDTAELKDAASSSGSVGAALKKTGVAGVVSSVTDAAKKPGIFDGVAGMLGKMNSVFAEGGAISNAVSTVNKAGASVIGGISNAAETSGFNAMMSQGSTLASKIQSTSQTARNWANGKFVGPDNKVVSIFDQPNKTLNQVINIQGDLGSAHSNVTGISGDWQQGRPFNRTRRKLNKISNFSF